MTDFVKEPERKIEVIADVDVVVAGGGPAGVVAALAAARTGARTLLLERYGFLGGMMTAGLVGPVMRPTATKSAKPIIAGVFREIAERLHAMDGTETWDQILQRGAMCFDPDLLKIVLDRMVLEAKIEVLLHTFVVDVSMNDGLIDALIVESKSGRQAVRATVFIDATGDGDVAFRAGAPVSRGRSADHRPMAMGSMFHLSGVRAMSDAEKQFLRAKLQEARESGEIRVYGTGLGGHGSAYGRGTFSLNMTRFGGDCTNVRDLTQGEFDVRRDTIQLVQFLRKNVPGCENCRIEMLPPQIGLRESRQALGDYVLTGQDVVECRKFDDQVALNSWWIDIHCPMGRTDGTIHLCKADCPADPPCAMLKEYPEELPKDLYLPEGGYNGIPYRCLTPQKVNNLLVAGRCLSATHAAMAGARIMATCMAMGQAAGIAGAMAADAGIAARKVDPSRIREAIVAAGGIVD